MTGETFDAGTVYAEARLDRDEFQRELAKLRKDMADFEKQQFRVKTGIDQSGLDADAQSVRSKVKGLGREKATPGIGADIREFMRRSLQVRRTLKQVHEIVSTPLILVDIIESMRRVAQLKYELRDLARRYVIDVVVFPQAFQEINRISDAMLSMKNVARVAIPSLLPLLGAAAGGATVLAASLLSAGSALGVFAIGTIPLLAGIVKKSKEIEDAQKKVTEAITDEQRKSALRDLELALGAVAESERQAVQDVGSIKAAWRDFQTSIQPAVFGMLHNSVSLISKLLPLLVPVIDAVAVVMNRWIDSMEAGVDSGGFKKFTDWLAGPGTQALDAWGTAVGNFVTGFINMLMAADPAVTSFNDGLTSMSERFLAWSQTLATNQQWQEFLRFTEATLPSVLTILGELVKIFWEVHRVFAPVTESVLGFIAGFMTAHPELTKFVVVGYVVMQFLTGLMLLIGGVVLKILLFAAVMGRIAGVIGVARIAVQLFGAVMSGNLGLAAKLAVDLFKAVFKLSAIGRIFGLARAATMAWTAAQWALNVAMAANPIGIVIAVVIALIAAIVLLWQNSETFRNIVTACWEAIKTAAVWAWENGIKPVVDWIIAAWTWLGEAATTVGGVLSSAWDSVVSALQTVGGWFTWLWDTILKPVFEAISLAVRVLIAVIWTVLVTPMILAWKAIAAIVTWAWESMIRPCLQALGDFFAWVWNSLIKPAWDALGAGIAWVVDNLLVPAWNRAQQQLQMLGDFFAWVWNSLIKPAWDALGAGIAWVVDNILVPTWEVIKVGLQAVGDFFQMIWNSVIKPAWDALGAGIKAVNDSVLTPVWDAIRVALDAVGGFFTAVWNSVIKPVWDALGAGIRWVYDNVLVPVWDGIKTALDAVGKAFDFCVNAIKTAWDRIQGIVGPPIRFLVNLVYNEGIVPAWNSIAGLVGLGKLAPVKIGFATGGVVPGYSPGVDRVPAMLSPGEGVVRPEVTRAVGPAWIHQVNEAAMRGGVVGVRRYMRTGGESAKPFERFAGGGIAGGQSFARSQVGKPYVWGGVGPGGYDCSGFMSAITNVLTGRGIHSRLFTTGSFGNGAGGGAGGFVRGTGSAFVIGVGSGHMSGNLGGLNVESSSSGGGVTVGGNARGPRHSLYRGQYYLPQVGGQFIPGAGGVDVIGMLTKAWEKVTKFLADIKQFASSMWGQSAVGMAEAMVKGAWDKLVSAATGGLLGAATGGLLGAATGGTFDSGGVIQPGWNHIFNGTGRPELAGRPDQWASLIDSARVARPAQDPAPGADALVAGKIDALIELLRDTGAGATVNVQTAATDPNETARAAVLALRMRRR